MTISGTISIEYKGAICGFKKYSTKHQRKIIIEKWIKNYKLADREYCLIINPIQYANKDLELNKLKGIISLYVDGNLLECKKYNSWENREKIIKDWMSQYFKREIYFEILPK